MQKLSCQIPAAMLERLTLLCARPANATRWSSTYIMFNRYVELCVFILRIKRLEQSQSQSLLTEVEDEVVVALFKKLHDLVSITYALQNGSGTSTEDRALFEEVILHFLSNADRLGTKSAIIEKKLLNRPLLRSDSKSRRDFLLLRLTVLKACC